MGDDFENEARAIKYIVDAGTHETVGLVYVWEDGVVQPLWFHGRQANVFILAIPEHRPVE